VSGGSSPDNDGTGWHRQTARVRQARRRGARRRNQWWNPLKWTAGSNLVDVGRSAVHAIAVDCRRGQLRAGLGLAGPEAAVKACGVTVARLQGKSWAPIPSNGHMVNVGTNAESPFLPPSQGGSGTAHRQRTARHWDGVLVVVRAQESCAHGEGGQPVRSGRAGRSGGRR
jgi:hypothetical protein